MKSPTVIKCTQCKKFKKENDIINILKLAVSNSITSSLFQFLKCSRLEEENKYFCKYCNDYHIASTETSFSNVGEFLIIQLKRFKLADNSIKKLTTNICCFPGTIELPLVVDNIVTMRCRFNLFAAIDHFGNLEAGHYTASLKDNGKWFHCDDRSVKEMTPNDLNKGHTYMLFYKKC